MGSLDLPDWNEGLRLEQSSGFSCSPVKQPLAQVTLKDGNTQRVSALGALGRPAAAAAAGRKPALQSTGSLSAALQPEPSHANSENDGAVALQAEVCVAEPPRSVRRTHTPSKTGLTGRAVRLPSRLGQGMQEQLAGQSAGPASNAAPAGNNLKSILKRLTFSTLKGRAAEEAPCFSAAAGLAPPHQHKQPHVPQSTTKQLSFDTSGATPAAATATKPGNRHVSFGSGTASPEARSRLVRPTGVAFNTPEPTIQEEDPGEDAAAAAAGDGSVNSNRAGHTPYDRRLSSLFRKYQVAGTPDLGDAELDALEEEGAARSPSWNRLSSASVPESIRELSKRYNSGIDSPRSLTPLGVSPPPASPAQVGLAGMEAEEAATPVQAQAPGTGSSPAMDPTPHEVLTGFMLRNALYESSPVEVPAVASCQPGPTRSPAAAGEPAAASGASGQLSPASALAQLLAPVLLATINDIHSTQEAQQGSPAAQATAASSPSLSSPAEFHGFPAVANELSTPGGSASNDGVPRDAEGIPAVTPATVTVRRGSYGGNLGAVMDDDDDLAANLFDSFSPDKPHFGGFSPGQPAAEQLPAAAAVAEPGATPGMGAEEPTGADCEFSFFPMASSSQQQQEAAAGATPELPAAGGHGNAAGAAAHSSISPEILGFYEAEAQRQAAAASTHTCATPAMPRSIIRSGRQLNDAGSPVLGHAQRVAADAPPPTITKELQALMSGLRLEDVAAMEQMGTVETLSPVRATGSMRGFLGGLTKAITPVRRSARQRTEHKPLEAMLEETGFSYVPNAALMAKDAQPKLEAAEAKAARKAASRASSQVTEPSSSTAAAGHEQHEVCSSAANRRGSANDTPPAGEEAALGMQAESAASTPGAQVQPAATRRMSLRQLRTPVPQAQLVPADEAVTPQATLQAMDAPVAQDASPQLQESPSFAAPVAEARPYRLRPSTVKKSRQSVGTPLAGAAGEHSSKKGQQRDSPQLSPTEQGIRAQLRRSARKSQGPK